MSEGGLGFEYRMNMGYPDKITDLIEHRTSELDWGMGELVHALCFRRKSEVRALCLIACWLLHKFRHNQTLRICHPCPQKTVAYLESHDQSLMGDQTVLFRLLKDQIYSGMGVATV